MAGRIESFATSESYLNGVELIREKIEPRAAKVLREALEPSELSNIGWKIRLRN
jgi:hypothetical protein